MSANFVFRDRYVKQFWAVKSRSFYYQRSFLAVEHCLYLRLCVCVCPSVPVPITCLSAPRVFRRLASLLLKTYGFLCGVKWTFIQYFSTSVIRISDISKSMYRYRYVKSAWLTYMNHYILYYILAKRTLALHITWGSYMNINYAMSCIILLV